MDLTPFLKKGSGPFIVADRSNKVGYFLKNFLEWYISHLIDVPRNYRYYVLLVAA